MLGATGSLCLESVATMYFLVALHLSHHIENSLTKLGTPRHMGLSVFRLSVYNKEEEVDFVLEKMPAIIESLRKNVTFLEGVTE